MQELNEFDLLQGKIFCDSFRSEESMESFATAFPYTGVCTKTVRKGIEIEKRCTRPCFQEPYVDRPQHWHAMNEVGLLLKHHACRIALEQQQDSKG